jgi:hypothetical protein
MVCDDKCRNKGVGGHHWDETSAADENVKAIYTKRERLARVILKVILGMLLLASGAALEWSPALWTVFGIQNFRERIVANLPARDLAEVRQIIRRETRRGFLPPFSKPDVRALSMAFRSIASTHISEILTEPDGTISVIVNVWERDPLAGGWTDWPDRRYVLGKGPKGWRIVTTWYLDHCRG